MGEARPRRARATRAELGARLVESVSGLGQCPGEKGGELTGPDPTVYGRLGTKYHLLVTADGLPLAVTITGANRHDSMLVEPILDELSPVKDRGWDVHGAVRGS